MKKWEAKDWVVRRLLPLALGVAVAAGLASCGGGGGNGTTAGSTTPAAVGTVMSSGVITAFGSVFVNGHRFKTDNAVVIDDDTGARSRGATGLEVGMVVDVKHREDGEEAEELHVHPLVRGFVDANNAATRTLTVMGQTVQLTSGTSFSDHRTCLAAATPCAPITTATGLASTTVSGTATTPGSYVTVHGFLFSAGTSPSTTATANVIATLVSVSDPPSGSSPFNFKAEGMAVVGTSTLTIGGLAVDLSKARCIISGQQNSCSAFTSGKVVSAGAATSPALPATLLVADVARQAGKVPVETAGEKVEIEGVVSSVGTTTFVVRGITVDTSQLPAGTPMPQVGDEVRVLGTLSASGETVQATSLSTEHEAHNARLALQGDVTSVTPGATTGTFTVTVLGQPIMVNAQTRLADMSTAGWDSKDPTSNPFNITTFQAYLAASTSRHVLVIAEITPSGTLVAQSLAILPASSVVAVAGQVDASPAPVNSTTSGTPTVFFVHGIQVNADPAAIIRPTSREGEDGHDTTTTTGTTTNVAAGDQVVVFGTLSGSTIVVGPTLGSRNRVVDLGVLTDDEDRDRGLF